MADFYRTEGQALPDHAAHQKSTNTLNEASALNVYGIWLDLRALGFVNYRSGMRVDK